MPEVYEEKPDVLEVKLSVDGTVVISKYVVGVDIAEIESSVGLALAGLVSDAPTPKPKRKRRTKAEIAAESTESDAKAWLTK